MADMWIARRADPIPAWYERRDDGRAARSRERVAVAERAREVADRDRVVADMTAIRATSRGAEGGKWRAFFAMVVTGQG